MCYPAAMTLLCLQHTLGMTLRSFSFLFFLFFFFSFFFTCNPFFSCVQDEEHVLFDFPSADLANLRVKHRQLFRSPSRNSNRLRDFIGQAYTEGRIRACVSIQHA